MDALQAGASHLPREGLGSDRDRLVRAGSVLADPLRARLLDAVIDAVDELGYADTTVADICRRAGVGRADFLDVFPDKHACFLAACNALSDALIGRAAAAVEEAADWQQTLRAGLGSVLAYLAHHPVEARACLVEGLAAGPEALAIRDVTMGAFATLLDAFLDSVPEVVASSAPVSEATVGGIYEVIIRRIRDGQTSSLPQLRSSLAYVLLAPVVGGERARLEAAALDS
jgi:AcrR family transcriptional regulator